MESMIHGEAAVCKQTFRTQQLPSLFSRFSQQPTQLQDQNDYLQGGHHADLMFSTEQDNESLRSARQFEKESIAVWIKEVREKNRKLKELLAALSPKSPSATSSTPAIENFDAFQDTEKSTNRLWTLGPRLDSDASSLTSAFDKGKLEGLEESDSRFIV